MTGIRMAAADPRAGYVTSQVPGLPWPHPCSSLYESAARSAEVLALDIEDLDLPNRQPLDDLQHQDVAESCTAAASPAPCSRPVRSNGTGSGVSAADHGLRSGLRGRRSIGR
jgi:hypothetical protein